MLSQIPESLLLPLNSVLLLSSLYLAIRIFWPRSAALKKNAAVPTSHDQCYSWKPATHPSVAVFKKYTPKSLEPFDGKDGGRILLAIDRKVFDVTAGRSFYGPDGMYGNFAGRDASRGMAKQSFDLDMLTPVDSPIDSLSDITPSEVENMKGWIEHFSHKYIVCGELVENGAV